MANLANLANLAMMAKMAMATMEVAAASGRPGQPNGELVSLRRSGAGRSRRNRNGRPTRLTGGDAVTGAALVVEVPICSVAKPAAKSNHRAAALRADAWIAPRVWLDSKLW